MPKGRMNLLEGIKKSMIIDSSYNASPKTMLAALQVLWDFPSKRKIAVLGSMNELGEMSVRAHQELGKEVPKYAQVLVTVGGQARIIADTAKQNGMPGHLVFSFETADEAGDFLRDFVKAQDVLLFKGSQNNVWLEKAIKKVMLYPKRAKEILVRQY
jgi:UDP-N-acetylmuramoyl-tripeptide--D-alanyl-D-alanine ligase